MRRLPLLAALLLVLSASAQESAIKNPYFETTRWKVWRDDPGPLKNVSTMVREGKEKKIVPTTLEPIPKTKRTYPVADPGQGRFLLYRRSAKPSPRYAGIWDDVYASWSGLHGYVRPRWKDAAGDTAEVLDQIIHFSDVTKRFTLKAGVNFIHQSTTGMAHTITNGYSTQLTENYEKLYFADALLTSPAHLSFTDTSADRSSDLYMALCPTLFNSVGSSNSETMAITKLVLAGGYLPPQTKLLLKRNGLYPAALLMIWKAALPYDVPYAHELRQRVAYKALGNRETYPEKYSHAGIDKGDLALAFHRYDDAAHMQAMVAMAASMQVTPPEAIFSEVELEGGTLRYALKKSVLVVQEKDQEIRIKVSDKDCYDLQDRPLKTRWILLYGNRDTSISRNQEGTVEIRVPYDPALPEGRTAIALVANNGVWNSNPAVITVYRKLGALPPNGGGYGDYKFSGTFTNRRPILLDLQDVAVRPGRTVELTLRAIDPEGFVPRYFKRAGQVGTIDGDRFFWRCPSRAKPGSRPVTCIVSDGTSGNSYGGKTITIHVGRPRLMAHITAGTLTGPAPLTVKVSTKGTIVHGPRASYGWEFYAPKLKRKATPFKKQNHKKSATHVFDKPGVYEVALTVQSGKQSDRETVGVLVTAQKRRPRPARLAVEDHGLRLREGDPVTIQEGLEHEFLLVNRGDLPLVLKGKGPVEISGPGAKRFKVTHQPRRRLEGLSSTVFRIAYRPKKEAGEAVATLQTAAGGFRFALHGEASR